MMKSEKENDMNTDPYVPTSPAVDHPRHVGLAALFAAMSVPLLPPIDNGTKHIRAGITKNHMRRRNKARAQMARESRKRNRVR